MEDVRTYLLRVRGALTAADVASFAPPGLEMASESEAVTYLIFRSDQAEMIGVLRHLHGLGIMLLSVESSS